MLPWRHRSRVGMSVLELVFTGAILLLIVAFAMVFMSRGRKARKHPPPELLDESFAGVSHGHDLAVSPSDGAAMDSDDKNVFLPDEYEGALRSDGVDFRSDAARGHDLAHHAREWTSVEPGAELRAYFSAALAVPGRPDWRTFLSLVRKLDPRQLPAAWSLLQEQPWSKEKQESMATFMVHWTQQDPAAAMDFALSLQSARQRHVAYGTAVETWAAMDPEKALSWYQEQQESDHANRVPTRHFFAGLYAADPQGTLEVIWEMEDPRQQRRVLRALFLSSAEERQRGATQLKTLFDESEDPDRRALLAEMIASVWAADNPMRAIEWGSSLEDDPDARQHVYMAAARAWGRREPAAAMAWLEEQDLDNVNARVLRDIARYWGRDDSKSLQQWIDSSSDSSMRDPVVATRVKSLLYRDPAAALALAESITEGGGRYDVMAAVADRWMRIDRHAAATAVLASSMPLDMKRKYAMKVIPKNWKREAAAKP